MALMTTNLTAAQRQQVLSYMAETAASKTLTAQQLAELSIDQRQALVDAGIITKKQLRTGATITLTKAELEKIIADEAILAKDKQLILSAFGVTEANLTEASSWEILGKSAGKALLALAKNPLTWVVVGVTALTVAYAKLASTAESAAEAQEKLKESESNLSSARDELATIDDKISEIKSKSGELGISNQAELQRLETERAILEDQVRLLELRKELSAEESNREAVQAVSVGGNKQEKWYKDADEIKIYQTTGYSSPNRDGIYKNGLGSALSSGYAFVNQNATTIDEYYKQIEEITKEIADWESKPDSKKRTKKLEKLRSDKLKLEEGLDNSKEDLMDIYLRDSELLLQITGDDEASNSARKKLQNEMAFLEQFIYTKEQLAKIRFDDFIKDENNKDVSDGFKDIQKDGEVTAQEITDLASKFPTLKKFMGDNGISAEILAAELNNVGTEAKNSGGNLDKMTVSLSELEKVSDNIKHLGTAFKELSDDGYITTKTLGEIQTATGLSGDEWENYKTKLLNAKSGSSEFNQIMSEMTYKILDNAFASKDLTSITEDEVKAILRENGVVNASAVAHDWLTKAKQREKAQSVASALAANSFSESLKDEADKCGLTVDAFVQLIAQEILFNKTNLSVSQQIEALDDLAVQAGITAEKIRSALMFDTILEAYNIDTYGIENAYRSGHITKDERDRRRQEILNSYIEDVFGNNTESTSPIFQGDSSSEKNEALDNYLKNAERQYKIHQDEERYIKDLQYAKDNLVKTDEEQLDILEKIDEAYRDFADNRIKDIEHQIDMEKQLYGEDAVDPTAKYEKIKEIAHDAAEAHRERLREMGYDDATIENTDEIQNYQKQYMDAVKAIDDFREDANSKFLEDYLGSLDKVYEKTGDGVKYINDLKWVLDTYEMTDEEKKDLREKIDEAYQSVADDDITEIENRISINTEVYGDSYDPVKDYQDKIRVAQGEINRLLSFEYTADSPEVQKWAQTIIDAEREIAEYQLGLYEQINQRVASSYEFRYNKEQALINGLQKQHDLHKQIRDERTELESELDASKSLEDWLDKKTRDQLFNEGDFADLSEKLDDISGEIDDIYSDYEKQISSLSIDEWYKEEEITAAFEARIEAQMESYEIAKKELEVEKKRNELQNVLNQRNTRVMTAGGWRQVADPAAVYEKQKELSKLEAEKTNLEADKAQSEIIRNRQLLNNATNTERLAIENRINMINEMTDAERKAYASRLPSTDSLKAMLALVDGTDVAMLDKGMNSLLGNILNLDDNETGNRYNSTIDYMSMMKDMPISDGIANGLNDVRNDKIKADKLPYVKLSQEELLKMSIPIAGAGLSAMSQGLNLFKNFSPVIHGQLPSVSQSHAGSSQNHYTFGDIIITNPVRDANDIVRELSVKMAQNFDLTKNMKQ